VTGDNLGTFISAKRVITGGILLGPLGAFGGALLKKNGTRVHVMLERDGENIGWIESGVRELPQMKKLAATINKASGDAAKRSEAKTKSPTPHQGPSQYVVGLSHAPSRAPTI